MNESEAPVQHKPRRGKFWWCQATRGEEQWKVELGEWPGLDDAGKVVKLHPLVQSRSEVWSEICTLAMQRRIPTVAIRIKWRCGGSNDEGEAL